MHAGGAGGRGRKGVRAAQLVTGASCAALGPCTACPLALTWLPAVTQNAGMTARVGSLALSAHLPAGRVPAACYPPASGPSWPQKRAARSNAAAAWQTPQRAATRVPAACLPSSQSPWGLTPCTPPPSRPPFTAAARPPAVELPACGGRVPATHPALHAHARPHLHLFLLCVAEPRGQAAHQVLHALEANGGREL
jgi:hypothetical protein